MKTARREVRNDIARAVRETMNPVWRGLVADRAKLRVEQRTLNTGVRVAAGNPPALIAAGSRRRLPGGLVPAEEWHALEFGAGNPQEFTSYRRRSRNGGTHTVRRRTKAQFLPRNPKGYVVYPAVKEIAPRLASLFVHIVVKKFADAVEKGG